MSHASHTREMRLFVDTGCRLSEHTAALIDPATYLTALRRAVDSGMDMGPGTKGRVVAALWICGLRKEVDELFATPGLLAPADILKAVKLLDAGREARQLERKLARLTESTTRVRKHTLTRIKARLNDVKQEGDVGSTGRDGGSASSSFLRGRVLRWIRAIPSDRLEFFLMNFSTQPWRELCDLVHTRPQDFQLSYFQSVVFGAALPEDSIVAAVSQLTRDNLVQTMNSHPALLECYSVIRKKLPAPLPPAARALIAKRAPLEDVVWFYEELHSTDADAAVAHRLKSGEKLDAVHGRSNYGKLMERLLVFRSLRCSFAPHLLSLVEQRLALLAASRDRLGVRAGLRCAVLGDASSSMSVAVRTATILGSLLTVLLDADLSFFNTSSFKASPALPRNCVDVLQMAETVRATGRTSPAAALWPFYQAKTPVDLFVVVTDEEENTACQGKMFAQMFRRYQNKVHPTAKVFFVSFLKNTVDEGLMVKRLREQGVAATQFRMDGQRPDLTKFDSLVAKIALCVQPGTSQVTDTPMVTEDEEEHHN